MATSCLMEPIGPPPAYPGSPDLAMGPNPAPTSAEASALAPVSAPGSTTGQPPASALPPYADLPPAYSCSPDCRCVVMRPTDVRWEVVTKTQTKLGLRGREVTTYKATHTTFQSSHFPNLYKEAIEETKVVLHHYWPSGRQTVLSHVKRSVPPWRTSITQAMDGQVVRPSLQEDPEKTIVSYGWKGGCLTKTTKSLKRTRGHF